MDGLFRVNITQCGHEPGTPIVPFGVRVVLHFIQIGVPVGRKQLAGVLIEPEQEHYGEE